MKKLLEYKIQEHLKPTKLSGISDSQINDHWSLYVGYVNQVNRLNNEIIQMANQNQADSLLYSDRRRRLGFEYNGMVLHEYYFENLCSESKNLRTGTLYDAIEEHWGNFELWQKDFMNTGKTRGIGWAILYIDTATNHLMNVFVKDHEDGHISSFIPLLVMDVWEHAYMVDHKSGGRADYINAFFSNINWKIVEQRFNNAIEKRVPTRF
jgi:superoxide dismutase, Fe-Mn family